MKVVVVLGSQGGTEMCLDDRTNCLVTCARVVSQIMEEAFGSVGIRPTIKVTAFDLNVLEAR